jgi:hypothetical protein
MPFGLSTLAVKAIGIGLLVLALLAGYAAFVSHQQAIGEAKNKAETAEASMRLAQEQQAKAAKIAADQQGIAHDAKLQADAARAGAARASAARDSLRLQLNAYVLAHRGASSPAASNGGAPAGDPIGVLAQVLGEADDFATGVAAEADANRIAGLACERSYSTLSTPTP